MLSVGIVSIVATMFIFLKESISASDRIETENTKVMIQSESIYGTTSGEWTFGSVSISVSRLPNIGETAVVTVTNNDLTFERYVKNSVELCIHLPTNLEFVDLESTLSYVGTSYITTVDIVGKDSVSLSATIRAIGEGNTMIIGSSGDVATTQKLSEW